MSHFPLSFGLSSYYLLLLLSLIFGTGRQALALQPPATGVRLLEDINGIHKESEEQKSHSSWQAVPLISLLLPQNTHSDTILSSKRLLPSRSLLLYAFTQYPHQQTSATVRHYPSRMRLLALQKLRLEGG